MKVYSETIFAFIEKANFFLKHIIRNETDLELRRTRFVYDNYLYPLDIIVFVGKTLGYFDPSSLSIGLNKCLLFQEENVVKDILRHELAHYITFLTYKKTNITPLPHGKEFKDICLKYGWSADIAKASANIKELEKKSLNDEKILRRVKKLLDLSASSNVHEAELATIKANELLLTYNLNHRASELSEHHHKGDLKNEIYVKQVLKQKRKCSKMICIHQILRNFLAYPIFYYGDGVVSIEVTGSKVNVELSQYMADFLNSKLDSLWEGHKKTNHLKGLKAKNSFFKGVAIGFEHKMNNLEICKKNNKSISVLNKNLSMQVKRIYKHLQTSSSKSSLDIDSMNLGKAAGKNLTINPGLAHSRAQNKTYLLE